MGCTGTPEEPGQEAREEIDEMRQLRLFSLYDFWMYTIEKDDWKVRPEPFDAVHDDCPWSNSGEVVFCYSV